MLVKLYWVFRCWGVRSTSIYIAHNTGQALIKAAVTFSFFPFRTPARTAHSPVYIPLEQWLVFVGIGTTFAHGVIGGVTSLYWLKTQLPSWCIVGKLLMCCLRIVFLRRHRPIKTCSPAKSYYSSPPWAT